MAREFGKVYMSAWGDRGWTSLDGEAQRMYMFLVSQTDLSRAGTITLALNRWANCVANYDRGDIVSHLAALARAGYVVVDEMTEELLVRTYIRHDDGWRSPNIMKAVSQAAQQVMSPTLRAVIRDEVSKISTDGLSDKISPTTGRSTREFIESLIATLAAKLEGCERDPSVMAWGTLPGTLPAGEGLQEPFLEGSPTTTTTATTTATATATAPAESAPSKQKAKAAAPAPPALFENFYAAYPKKTGKQAAIRAFAKAARQVDPERIVAGSERYRDDPNLPPRGHPDRQFIPDPASWLNAGRWDDDPLPPRAGTHLAGGQKPASPMYERLDREREERRKARP